MIICAAPASLVVAVPASDLRASDINFSFKPSESCFVTFFEAIADINVDKIIFLNTICFNAILHLFAQKPL